MLNVIRLFQPRVFLKKPKVIGTFKSYKFFSEKKTLGNVGMSQPNWNIAALDFFKEKGLGKLGYFSPRCFFFLAKMAQINWVFPTSDNCFMLALGLSENWAKVIEIFWPKFISELKP